LVNMGSCCAEAESAQIMPQVKSGRRNFVILNQFLKRGSGGLGATRITRIGRINADFEKCSIKNPR